MGVGLYLIGTLGACADPLATAHALFRERYGADLLSAGVTGDTLQVVIHPAAEPIDITVDGDRLTVSAKTSTVGPGYHAELCDALHALATRLPIAWAPPDEDEGTGDETGYFVTRDRAALEAEMLRWLATVAKVLAENREATGLGLSMPMAPRYHGPPGAAVLTQVGPRAAAWLAAVLADPRAGIDLFPWWEPGRGAAYELGRVQVHLWLDVRFRPAATEAEEELGRDLLARLGRAYRSDPTLAYPYAAWSALHDDVIDADDDDLSVMVRQRGDADDGEPIGYRHHAIDATLPGGWRVTLPGSFAEEIDPRGTWSAWEDGHTVWATSFSVVRDGAPVPADRVLPTEARDGTPTEIAGLALHHRAHVQTFEEDGATYWRLATEIAAPGQLLLLDVVVPGEAELVWARDVVASVAR